MNHYYPVTIAEVTRALFKSDLIESSEEEQHLRWMCDEIAGFDPFSLDAALKAGRWIGWILAHVEEIGLWTNVVSRDLVRADALHHRDRPLEAA